MKNQTGGIKMCRQRLYQDGVFVARCTVSHGVKHNHGKNIAKMVAGGYARYIRRSS